MFNCVKYAFLSLHSLFQDIIITLYCSGYVPSAVPGRLELLGTAGGGEGKEQRAAKEQSARGVRRHAAPEDFKL